MRKIEHVLYKNKKKLCMRQKCIHNVPTSSIIYDEDQSTGYIICRSLYRVFSKVTKQSKEAILRAIY